MSDFIKLVLFTITAIVVVVVVGPVVIFVGAILAGVIAFGGPVILLFTGVWFIWFCFQEHSEETSKKK